MTGTNQATIPKKSGTAKPKKKKSSLNKRHSIDEKKKSTEKREATMQVADKKQTGRNKKRKQTASSPKNAQKKVSYRKKPPSTSKKILALIWDILFYVFLVLIVVGAIFFNFNDSPDKSFFGYRFMTVLTNSMAPNPEKPELTNGFVSGDIIILKQTDPKSLKEKDIITFYPVIGNNEAYLTHRVIKMMNELDGEEGLFIQTQGDANTGADIPIQGKQVVGKVIFTIPAIGNFINFIRDNLVVVTIFIATLFGFFLTLKYYLGMESMEKVKPKKRKRPVPS